MRVQGQRRQTLSVIVSPLVYQRLRKEVGEGKISRFVEEAIVRKLDDYEENLQKEQQEFQKKLIAGYKRSAQSKALKKENEIWDEVIGDGIE
jgi:hypothetical protein